ncbi:unnamed protein product [Linum trigynum]|uniref:Retrotransposon gag domain-containing protein n=1 Tax=Linum trigynum TaxID=586398 RepID=A0AAV2DGJ3_9ROSI
MEMKNRGPWATISLHGRSDIQPTILHPPVAANNFKIKPDLFTIIQNNTQFQGLQDESPRDRIQRFIEIARSLKINGVSDKALKLKLFPYSHAGKALRWLNNRTTLSITSWDDLLNKLMARYCPPSKTVEWQKKITHFAQEEEETLRDAWERYSEFFLQCLHHGFGENFWIEIFYDGLLQEDKILIDSLCQGNLTKRTPLKMTSLLEDMATKGYGWGSTRCGGRDAKRGVHST